MSGDENFPEKRVEVKSSEDKYQLVLPCDVKDFTQFMSGLLGKPQTESGVIDGVLHVEPRHISNIYHLINQRVIQQNEGSLAHFSIKVLYNNGASVTHNNVSDFESYYPTSKTHPEEIVISFTYLIKFRNSEVPEKQVIEVIVSTNEDRVHSARAWASGGIIEYRIHHTDRTWSSDIANVLKNHCSTFIDKYTKIWEFARRSEDDFLELTGILVVFSYVTYLFYFLYGNYLQDIENDFRILDFSRAFLGGIYIGVCLFVFLRVIEKLVEYRLFIRKRSFITLVDKDYEMMRKMRKRDFWRISGYICAWIFNVIAGVVASSFFAKYWG